MNPLSELDELLAGLAPGLEPEEYVFCTLPCTAAMPAALAPLATMREAEGLSLVLPAETPRDAGLACEGPFRLITLRVHSSLKAVGLTAAVAGALAAAGISANVVAGYHHDHLFVPADRAEDALAVLCNLSETASGGSRGSPGNARGR